MKVTYFNHYFFLSEGKTIVHGSKHSILLDTKDGKIYHANPSARLIIDFGEQGLNISETVKKSYPEFETSDVLSFLKELSNQGIIQFSKYPKQKSPEKVPIPKLDFLWIELTSHCNLRCVHCYAEAETTKVKEPMGLSIGELKKIIDEAAGMNCRKLQLTGGEPTFRDDLKELIKHAKTMGFEFIEIFTNGTLLTEPIVKFFADEGVNIAMSIYSHRADTHDAITRVPGSFEKTLNSLKLLLAYGVTTRCAVIAMKQNEKELDGTSYFLSQLGVFSRPPDPIRPSGRGKGMNNWPQIYGLKFIRATPNFFVSAEAYERNRRWNSCWSGKAAVTSTGDVLPCVFSRDQVAGNVKKESLSEIVQCKKMLSFWSLTKDQIEICRDCEYRYICEDCRPLAYGSTGNLYAKSPRCTYNPHTGEWAKAEEMPGLMDSIKYPNAHESSTHK